MKRKILKITSLLACVMVMISLYYGYRYYSHHNVHREKKLVSELLKDIRNERKKVQDKSKQIDSIKNRNKEKSEILEVWQKESQKLKG